MLDATRKEIIIGELYGYSTNKNGFQETILGYATKVSEDKVSLKVIERARYMYGGIQGVETENLKSVCVYSLMCYKVKL